MCVHANAVICVAQTAVCQCVNKNRQTDRKGDAALNRGVGIKKIKINKNSEKVTV